MYAGKEVTTDGSVLIGRTVDFSPYNATMFQQLCEAGGCLETQTKENLRTGVERYLEDGGMAGNQIVELSEKITGKGVR